MTPGSQSTGVMSCACVTVLLVAAPLYGEPVTTIQRTGAPDNRVDIVVLGDGYRSVERAKFAADVESFVIRMLDQDPFSSYRSYFNVHRIEVVSAESGADHPSRGIYRETALHATFDCAGIERLICVDHTAVENVLARSVRPDARDVVIVLANDPQYGGSGGAIAVSSTHGDGLEIVMHELGHSVGLLADEYDSSPPECVASTEPIEPNVTIAAVRANIKWRYWIAASTPIPSVIFEPAIPGLYEGARYCVTGMYRPTADSKMRSLGRPFEQINVEQLVKRLYNLVEPIDLSSPSPDRVVAARSENVRFQIVKLRPVSHALRVNWELDGRVIAGTDSITVDTAALASGDHAVRVTVLDPTSAVRNDPDRVLIQTRSWVLHVSEPVAPAVTVLLPNGGEVLASSVPVTVQWTASDADGLARFDVEISTDGVNFGLVAECSLLPGTRRSCTVNTPGAPTTRGRVRVTAYDTRGDRAFDVSDGAFTIVATGSLALLPPPWTSSDVGNIGRTGLSTWSAGVFQSAAAGTGVWSSADAFHFVHQRWTGDGDMVVRVEQLLKPADAVFAMAGVMFRESLAPGARHASLVIASNGKAKFRRRPAADGTTLSNGPGENTTPVPRWLKLSRRGNMFTAYLSSDRVSWTQVAPSQAITMPQTLHAGFLSLRRGGDRFATARVTGVSLLPAPWSSTSIGAQAAGTSATYKSGAYTLSAGGTDVWSSADAFHFVHQRWTGDGEIVVRVEQLHKPADAVFAMAGVMFRESLAPGARHASLVIASNGKAKFRRRLAAGGTTLSTGPGENTTRVPHWLKLSRRGNVFTAYLSSDCAAWTQVAPSQTIAMPQTLHVGFLALRSGGDSLATVRLTGVRVWNKRPPP